MEITNALWAVPCTRGFGGFAASDATGMSTAALAGIVRKPANVDVRYGVQGDPPAWSPPV